MVRVKKIYSPVFQSEHSISSSAELTISFPAESRLQEEPFGLQFMLAKSPFCVNSRSRTSVFPVDRKVSNSRPQGLLFCFVTLTVNVEAVVNTDLICLFPTTARHLLFSQKIQSLISSCTNFTSVLVWLGTVTMHCVITLLTGTEQKRRKTWGISWGCRPYLSWLWW